MRLFIVFTILVVSALGCSSSDDSNLSETDFRSSNIIAVSGDAVPIDADLVIHWSRVSSRQDVEFFITGGGELSNGTFTVEPPATVPTDAIAQGNGVAVAVGIILAFEKGLAPADGAYSNLDLSNAIGLVNAHSIVYTPADVISSAETSGLEGWWDDFIPGFECARNIDMNDVGFDTFEPIECSQMILRTGVVSEIMVVGGEWN